MQQGGGQLSATKGGRCDHGKFPAFLKVSSMNTGLGRSLCSLSIAGQILPLVNPTLLGGPSGSFASMTSAMD